MANVARPSGGLLQGLERGANLIGNGVDAAGNALGGLGKAGLDLVTGKASQAGSDLNTGLSRAGTNLSYAGQDIGHAGNNQGWEPDAASNKSAVQGGQLLGAAGIAAGVGALTGGAGDAALAGGGEAATEGAAADEAATEGAAADEAASSKALRPSINTFNEGSSSQNASPSINAIQADFGNRNYGSTNYGTNDLYDTSMIERDGFN